MSEAAQTANSTDAREASMARVTTLADLVNQSADAPPKAEPAKAEAEHKETESKPKSRFSERITEVIAQKKAAEAEADRIKREADELRAELERLRAQADPVKQGDKPTRSQFGTDDDYVEALADWKAQQAIAKREQEQAEARAKAEMAEVTRKWEARIGAATKEIDDFAEVVGSAEVQVADHISQAILRSEQGPLLLYYLASHQDEARKLNRMHPIDSIRYLADLERDFGKDTPKAEKTVERSKAPEPISPVRQASAIDPGPSSNFEEYRARRQAERKR